MSTDLLFCGVATADLLSSQAWYELLLGRSADVIVNDDEVMWKICDGGWLYLVHDSVRAGHALVAIAVSDLDELVDEITSRGFDRPEIEILPGAGRKAPFLDSEGNTVTFIQVLPKSE